MIGPFSVALAQKKIIIIKIILFMATNYFNKWMKTKAYVTIKDKDITNFLWKSVVYRFGIPRVISQTMGPNSIVYGLVNFVWSWGSRISTHLPTTLNLMC